jgi:nucleoside triphosphate pyrophosphatase
MNIIEKPVIILASKSPRRQELISRLDIPFIVKPSDIDESTEHKDIGHAVLELAEKKLDHAINENSRAAENWIFAADTLVFSENMLLGKPETEEEAFDYIKMLSGKSHTVATALALYNRNNNKKQIEMDETSVIFPDLDDEIIRWYISTGEWKGAAGGYRIQEKGGCLVDRIEGSYSNVMGLPIRRFFCMLLGAGYPVNK